MSWSVGDLQLRFDSMARAHRLITASTFFDSSSITPLLALFAGGVELFLCFSIVARILDMQASKRLKDALTDAPTIRALARISELQGEEFIVDTLLNDDVPCKATSMAAASPAARSAASAFPLLAVARGAKSPVETILESGVIPDDASGLIAAAARANGLAELEASASAGVSWGKLTDRIDAAVGHETACGTRCCMLRGVLVRYILLKIYFFHALLSPFTRYDAKVPRFVRVIMLFDSLSATILADAALYSFYSRGIGVIDVTSYLTLYFGAFHIVGIILSILICTFTRMILVTLLDSASELAFRSRYPIIAAEQVRRRAADMRAAVMSPEELAAAVAAAKLAQAAHAAALAKGETEDNEADDNDDAAPSGGASNNNAARGAKKPAAHAASVDLDTPPSPTAAAAAASLLLQNPSENYLLAIAAAPFLAAANAKVAAAQKDLLDLEALDGIDGGTAGGGGGALPATPTATVAHAAAARKCQCFRATRTRAAAAPADASAVVTQQTALRDAALREETRAASFWKATQSGLTAAARAHAAFESRHSDIMIALRDITLQMFSAPALVALLVVVVFSALFWYMVCALAVQSDAVAAIYFPNWLMYQAAVLFVLHPILVVAGAVASLVLWPATRDSIFRLPCGIGRMLRRGAARSAARTANKKNGSDPDSVRAAAFAAHFPVALALLAYGVVTVASAATSDAVNKRVAAAKKTSDEEKIESTIAARVQEAAEDEADAEADEVEKHEEATKAAIARSEPPPPPPVPMALRSPSVRAVSTRHIAAPTVVRPIFSHSAAQEALGALRVLETVELNRRVVAAQVVAAERVAVQTAHRRNFKAVARAVRAAVAIGTPRIHAAPTSTGGRPVGLARLAEAFGLRFPTPAPAPQPTVVYMPAAVLPQQPTVTRAAEEILGLGVRMRTQRATTAPADEQTGGEPPLVPPPQPPAPLPRDQERRGPIMRGGRF